MKILITGGLGFIGSHLADALIKKKHDVTIIDKLDTKVHPYPNLVYKPNTNKIIIKDICDIKNLDKILNDIEIIYHFASHQDYEDDYTNFIDNTLRSTSYIFECYKKTDNKKLKKFILSSSQSIYGEGFYKNNLGKKIKIKKRTIKQLKSKNWDCNQNGNIIKHKEGSINPLNFYGWSKKAQEELTIFFCNLYSIKYTIFRYSIVQGERQSFFNNYSGLCRNLITKYMINQKPIIYEDGQALRDYINIHDVTDVNLIALKNTKSDNQIFNIGGEKSYSVNYFDELVRRLLKTNIMPYKNIKFRLGDVRHTISDISKVKRILNWAPKRSLKFSIKSYIKWLNKSQKKTLTLYMNKKHFNKISNSVHDCS